MIQKKWVVAFLLLSALQVVSLQVAYAETSPDTLLQNNTALPQLEVSNELQSLLENYVESQNPVFTRQTYLKASNTEDFAQFGWSVAVSGNTVVVGAPVQNWFGDLDGPGSGAAYVFTRNSEVWSQQAYLKASNSGPTDNFAYSVAIDRDTMVIGAPYEKSPSTGVDGDQTNNGNTTYGAAYVFTRSSGIWSQQAYLKASNTGAGDGFGYSVAVSGDTIVVGANREDSNSAGIDGDQSNNDTSDAGAAYIFNRSSGVWSQQAYLKGSIAGVRALFGSSVSIDSDTVLVSAPGDIFNNTPGGSAFVFVRNSGVWSQQASLQAANPESRNRFGASTSIDGDFLAIGATGVNNSAGAVYVFARSSGIWSQDAQLTASNAENDDRFGFSVSLSGDKLLVGAIFEDSSSTGINGDQINNETSAAGAAYGFTRSNEVWGQQTYLKASNTEPANNFSFNDHFGVSVSIDGDLAVAGAIFESSSSTGVNGDQTNNESIRSGAAYLFDTGNEGSPTLISPTGVVTSQTPAFSWTGAATDTHYYLNIWGPAGQAHGGWVSSVDAGCVGGGVCSHTPTSYMTGESYLYYGAHYIYALAYNGTLPLSRYSRPLVFHVSDTTIPGATTLLTPSGSIASSSPTFSWNAHPTSTFYLMYIADDDGAILTQWFSHVTAGCPSGTGVCSVTPSALIPSGSTRWFIKTYNPQGQGAWSSGLTFSVP